MTNDLVASRHPTVLDWRDSRHWSTKRRCCIHCGCLTNLRNDDDRPAHKTCAEAARKHQ